MDKLTCSIFSSRGILYGSIAAQSSGRPKGLRVCRAKPQTYTSPYSFTKKLRERPAATAVQKPGTFSKRVGFQTQDSQFFSNSLQPGTVKNKYYFMTFFLNESNKPLGVEQDLWAQK